MKKFFALILAAMMLFAFTACGKDNTDNNTTTTTAPETTATTAAAPETAAAAVTTTPATTAVVTTEAETPSTPAGAVIEAGATEVFRGTVSDNIYMSAFSGLTFTADENWKFLTDAELASMLGATEDDLKNDKLQTTLKTKGVVYDMYAQLISEDNILDANVIVMLLDTNNVDFKGKNLEESVNLLASTTFGVDLTSATTGSASFGGENYYKLDSSTDKANVSIFGCEIGEVYVVCVTAGSKESGIDLISMFK